MGYTDITRNEVVAKQVLELLSRLERPSKERNIECTLLLAASSLLLGQTSDRARSELQIEPPNGRAIAELDANELVKSLPRNLQRAGVAWYCSWSRQNFPRLTSKAPGFGEWRYIRKYERVADLDEWQFTRAIRKSESCLPDEMPKYKLLRIVRNAIAHGGVQWMTASDDREQGSAPITGALFLNLTNPDKCSQCGHILESREAQRKGTAVFELVQAPLEGFRHFIKDWAKTLKDAGATHMELELAVTESLPYSTSARA